MNHDEIAFYFIMNSERKLLTQLDSCRISGLILLKGHILAHSISLDNK